MSGSIRLIDRGIPMLEASLAATLSVRLDLDDATGYDEALKLLRPYGEDLRRCEARETGIVLLHSLDAQESAERSLAREADANDTYRRYQHHLAIQILRQVGDGRFTRSIVVGERSIMAVQDELRATLRDLGVPCPPCTLSQARVVALGGMSESGKSTAADWLRCRHGYSRLKIGFLLEQAAERHKVDDVYSLDGAGQAELLVDSLDRYLAAHDFGDRITIESLHRYEATLALRTLLGTNLSVIYLDTSQPLRHERGAEAPVTIAERDRIKRERGADQIHKIADRVLTNDGSLLRLHHHLDELALSLAWPTAAPRVVSASGLGLPQALTDHVNRLVTDLTTPPIVDLLAVTGSGSRGKYEHGWSDLDILLIADHADLKRIRGASKQLRDGLGTIKLGLTLVTLSECRSGALTPRLVHTLRQIGTGEVPVLWCTPGLRLPFATPVDDAAASLADGAVAAVELRRQLLRPVYETRALVKFAALLAKVILRMTHDDHADDEIALRTFLTTQGLPLDPKLIRTARANIDDARAVALTVLDGWLGTLRTIGGHR